MAKALLNWVLPTTRDDVIHTPLSPSEISSVDIFDTFGGGVSGPTTTKIGTATGAATSFTTSPLDVGDHAFTVVINDTTGHSSVPSNVASLTVPPVIADPSPATNLTATLIP